MDLTDVALIPARGGSKGILRKNLIDIHGRSLLQRAINSAQDSGKFSNIFVSSDDEEILAVAKASGVSIIERSKSAALDSSSAIEVVIDFLTRITFNYSSPIRVSYLQPTSPFRTSIHISEALKIASDHSSNSCVSICRVRQHPAKMLTIEANAKSIMKLQNNADVSANRQDLPLVYIPNGAIFVFLAETFLRIREFPIFGSGYLEMDETSSIDIDSHLDLILARSLEL